MESDKDKMKFHDFWQIYSDQTDGSSPEMVVKSEGSVPQNARNNSGLGNI